MPPALDIGSVIGGYRIEAQIGQGGMGVVYRAEQIRLRRQVAVKVIAPDLAQDPGFRERFESESRLAASIEHPNVLPVHEAGEAQGLLFISMRYVQGTDLRAMIADHGRLDPPRAARIVAQVAGALDAAHARGLVHRDVKPANVLIGAGTDHAYLTDFGLTKKTTSLGGVTKTGEFVGTIDYVAPEQIQGGAVDARADGYALGCVLHQTLTGQVPFVRDSDVAKIYAHLSDPPPSVTQLVHDVPFQFDAIVARAMAKDPSERYPSAGDLGRAAQAAAEGQLPAAPERSVARGAAAPATAPAAPPPPPPTAVAAPATTRVAPGGHHPGPPSAPTEVLPPRRGGRAAGIVAAAVLGAALLAGGLFAAGVFESDEEPAGESAAQPAAEPVTEEETAPPTTDEEEQPPPSDDEPPPAPVASYSSGAYTAEYPSDWTIAEDDVLKTTFSRTRFVSADGSQSVLIDRSPGEGVAPADKANEVEAATSATSGYERISFQETTVSGRPAFEWTFEIDSQRKIDIFLNIGGDGYAILGEGADFDEVLTVARQVAQSIEPL